MKNTITTTWILASALACAQPAPADWPEAVGRKIDEVLAVKKEAMALPKNSSNSSPTRS
jgi:hypothetical protein